MQLIRRSALAAAALLLAGCSLLPAAVATDTSALPASATAGAAPSEPPKATTNPQARPPEAIAILQPGAGSRLRSPLHVLGEADPTFENYLSLRLLMFDGSTLAETTATIQAPVGERGQFEGELAFDVADEQPALLQVFATSPRDGNILHLSSVVVTLAETGEPAPQSALAGAPEQVHILQPAAGERVSGGSTMVRGFGLASFEQTLVVRLEDGSGATVAEAPLIVDAPDLGQPGPFAVELNYSVTQAGPGRIVVWDPSPAFGGAVHLSSIEVELAP